MSLHRSRSRSPDGYNKRTKYSRDDDRRHEYRYEDESYSRPRYRDDRSRDHHPKLYRADDRDGRRDDSRSRYRESDRGRHRDDDRRSHRRHYQDDDKRHIDRGPERERERDRDRDRDRERDRDRDREKERDGSRANGASPRTIADNRSRSPHHSLTTSRSASPSAVNPFYNPANDQKSQMTDVQRQRLEKMELWKKRKAAETAAKNGNLSVVSANSTTTNDSPTDSTAPRRDSKSVPVFALTRAASKTSGNDLEFDEEDGGQRKLEMLPSLTAQEQAQINAAAADDAEDQDIKLEDDDEEARKHINREGNEAIKMDIDEGDRLPHRPAAMPEVIQEKMQVDDDVDPLDAFMLDVDKEARKIDEADISSFGTKTASNTRMLMGDEDDDGAALNSDGELPEQHYASAQKRAKSKELATVDHSKIKYEPFIKDFYIPPPEYRDLTDEDILDLRLELSGITIRGKDCPAPVTKWSQCGLNATTLDVVTRLGYQKPTPIQSQAIPAVMSGRDVIGVAQTGSGKTIAFLLPMFRHITNQRPLSKNDGPISLILSPTRELATQIYKDCKPFLKALGLRALCAYGGPPIQEQIAQLKTGVEIVVCTPGRMIDLLAANGGRIVNLQRVTYVVLDEADRQFDMGFEPQVMKILSNVRPDRQTVLFSATFPKQMEALARKILKRPIEISVGNKSVVAPEIEQSVEVVKEEDKFNRLLGILGDMYAQPDSEDDRALIFVERQEGADYLLGLLLKRGYPCLSIHGGKDQVDRDQAISDFKAGAVPILTATSVAARGLDVKQLKLVVNFDCPNHMEDYVHRVGRTGRAGNRGVAITFITPEQNKYAKDIIKALNLSGVQVPAQLEQLAVDWQALVDSGRAYAVGSGFRGKGLDRFDADREAVKRLQRREHGDDDDEEKEGDIFDEDGERKTPANGIKAPQDKAVAEAVSKVHQVLHGKGQLRTGVPVAPKVATDGPTSQTLEINDLAQSARWAVTNRTNIAKVLDQTGVSITTKGSFFPPGRLPGVGESKLNLLVEGDTPVQVEAAMRELRRLLSEASDEAIVTSRGAAPTGRYNVMGY